MNGDLLFSNFLRCCNNAPERLALMYKRNGISYAELEKNVNRIANLVAHQVQDKVGPVAVFLDDALQQVLSIIGVSISGHPFVPVSTVWPTHRVECALTKIQPVAIISDDINCKKIKNFNKEQEVPIIKYAESLSSLNRNFRRDVSPSELAYIIFTSGTTGIPKGVAIKHCSVLNTVNAINDMFDVNENDTVFSISDVTFDLSIYDMVGLLSVGGSVLIPDKFFSKDPSYWIKVLIENNVTIWNSVPMFMLMLVEYLEIAQKQGNVNLTDKLSERMRLILLSGDKIPINLPDRIRAFFPNARIISLGGATEASIWSVMFPIENVFSTWNSIPYGKALRNQKVFVLDNNLENTAYDIAGEIYIGGDGVADCYYGDERLTQEKFVIHKDYGRLYATGDIGRLLVDGNIEILGRKDNQIKLNGFRIELEEIEKTILCNLNVSNVRVVKMKAKKSGEDVLVAVLGKYTGTRDAKAIRHKLKDHLPLYEIPSKFLFVNTLPLTENGKVDVKLLEILINKSSSEAVPALPDEWRNDPIRKELLSLISSFLENKECDWNLDFYSLGGTSLTAIRICADIFSKFNVKASVPQLIEAESIKFFIDSVCATYRKE